MEKKMYRYYQTDEKGPWHPLVDSPDIEAIALGHGAKKLTILALSELVSEETNREGLTYRGPLYFDIDSKVDLNSTFEATQRLLSSLLERGVDPADIHVYCSGSKGMHVLVCAKAFSNGRVHKRLPTIYKEMAVKLYVAGMDFQPYGTGRGNAFRIVNVKRDDGRYRIAITHEELQALDAESYVELCSKPRDYVHPPFLGKMAPVMEVMFEHAKQLAGKKLAPVIGASNSALEKISHEAPNCVNDIANYKRIATDKSFNYVAMQLGIWVARAGVDPLVYNPIVERLANNSASAEHSANDRKDKVEAQIGYMRATKNYEFSCSGMRSALAVRPCEGCPIECGNSSTSGDNDTMGVVRKPDGFYLEGKDRDVRLTTFALTPTAAVVDYPQDGSAPRRIGTQMLVDDANGPGGEILFREAGWQSSAAFKSEVAGLGNFAVVGGDKQIQRIKHLVYAEAQDQMNEIRQVYTAGIHLDERPDGLLATFVEPSYSINNYNLEDTYRLQGLLLSPSCMKPTKPCEKGDEEADTSMAALCRMNDPEDLAIIIGFFAVCHLKEHFRLVYNMFPQLGVWGSSSAGKSETVNLVANLSGMQLTRNSVMNVSSITPFAALMYAGSTTTIPRIMEECNKAKMGQRRWNEVTEILKSSWGCEAHGRGGLGPKGQQGRTGGTVTAIPVSGPCVTISEQAIDVPAVVARSLQVMLSTAKRAGRTADHITAKRGAQKLREIGKYLMLSALLTPLEAIKAEMAEIEPTIPMEFDDRPRHSHAVVRFGLQWLLRCMQKLELVESAKEVQALLDAHIASMDRVAVEAKSRSVRSEIDAVIETMGAMAALSAKMEGRTQKHLEWGTQYTVTEDHVFIEPSMAHLMYKRYKSSFERETPVIDNVMQFVLLLRQEPYYAGEQVLDGISKVRPCIKLSKAKMIAKGIDATLFYEEDF